MAHSAGPVNDTEYMTGLAKLTDLDVDQMSIEGVKQMLMDLRAVAPAFKLDAFDNETIARMGEVAARSMLLDARDYARRQ